VHACLCIVRAGVFVQGVEVHTDMFKGARALWFAVVRAHRTKA
jgi:hypothetical protein